MAIGYSVHATGPALLLLHGFPETRLMWRDLVPLLAADHTVVTADLPGYGASTVAPGGRPSVPWRPISPS
jgi:haloacetate dehalogenase